MRFTKLYCLCALYACVARPVVGVQDSPQGGSDPEYESFLEQGGVVISGGPEG